MHYNPAIPLMIFETQKLKFRFTQQPVDKYVHNICIQIAPHWK